MRNERRVLFYIIFLAVPGPHFVNLYICSYDALIHSNFDYRRAHPILPCVFGKRSLGREWQISKLFLHMGVCFSTSPFCTFNFFTIEEACSYPKSVLNQRGLAVGADRFLPLPSERNFLGLLTLFLPSSYSD